MSLLSRDKGATVYEGTWNNAACQRG
jgi:hypothetical protein